MQIRRRVKKRALQKTETRKTQEFKGNTNLNCEFKFDGMSEDKLKNSDQRKKVIKPKQSIGKTTL